MISSIQSNTALLLTRNLMNPAIVGSHLATGWTSACFSPSFAWSFVCNFMATNLISSTNPLFSPGYLCLGLVGVADSGPALTTKLFPWVEIRLFHPQLLPFVGEIPLELPLALDSPTPPWTLKHAGFETFCTRLWQLDAFDAEPPLKLNALKAKEDDCCSNSDRVKTIVNPRNRLAQTHPNSPSTFRIPLATASASKFRTGTASDDSGRCWCSGGRGSFRNLHWHLLVLRCSFVFRYVGRVREAADDWTRWQAIHPHIMSSCPSLSASAISRLSPLASRAVAHIRATRTLFSFLLVESAYLERSSAFRETCGFALYLPYTPVHVPYGTAPLLRLRAHRHREGVRSEASP